MTNSTASNIETSIINSFNAAVANSENITNDGSINWSYVDADMCIELGSQFSCDYLGQCLNILADQYMANQ